MTTILRWADARPGMKPAAADPMLLGQHHDSHERKTHPSGADPALA